MTQTAGTGPDVSRPVARVDALKVDHTDVRRWLQVVRRRKWLLAILVVVPVGAYAYAARGDKTYKASVTIQVQAPAVDTSLFSGDLAQASPQTVNAASRLVKTTAVAADAARRLRPQPSDARGLLDQITSTADVASGFVTVTASAPSGRRAADLANAFGNALVAQRTKQAVGRLNATIGDVLKQIARFPPADRDARSQLTTQVERLRALRAAQGSNAAIIERATVPASASATHALRAAALALIVALLLGLGAVALAERLDRRLRDPDRLEELTGVPVLGIIPQSAFTAENRSSFLPEESFEQLRSRLMFFNTERPLSSILVTSTAAGDGKTTVATKLAVAFAKAGKDVILVDADLRRPQIADRFEIASADGLGAALAFESAVDSLMTEVEVDDPEGARLRVLPTGTLPSNPSGLIASARMRILLAQLVASADIVIIDTPSLLEVSDPMPLLAEVSGVVVVVKIDYSTRDSLARLLRVIANAKGAVLGVVATNVDGQPSSGGSADRQGDGASEADAELEAVNAELDALNRSRGGQTEISS